MTGHIDALESAFGLESNKYLPDPASVARGWQSGGEGYALFPPRESEQIRKTPGIPMQVIATDPLCIRVKEP